MTTSHAKWRPLPTFPDLPALLISPGFHAESSSYSLAVTDLANVWTESLDRKGILRRSLNEDTSIDISDGGREQWRVFLSKLEAAFDPASPDHELTSLTLSPHGGAAGGLLLHITCVLPEPLRPLEWPVFLAKRRPDVLASELVVPLIRANQVRAQENEYLVARLKDKDAVINRLVDKLEAVGTGLEHVFHSLPIKRKATRAMAEEKVEGLAPFNENLWRSQCASTVKTHQDTPSLLLDAFENGSINGGQGDIKVSEQVNDWWKGFNATAAVSKPKDQTALAGLRQSTSDGDKSAAKSDDDFQVQATPPSAKGNRERSLAGVTDGDTTDDSDSITQIPDSHPKVEGEKPRTLLGTLGARKAASQRIQSRSQSSYTIPNNDGDDTTTSGSEDEPVKPSLAKKPGSNVTGAIEGSRKLSPLPAKSSSPARPLAKDDDEIASDSDAGSPMPHSSPAPEPAPAPAPVQRRGGLGQIGGVRSRATPAPADDTRETSPAGSASAAQPRPRRKLGAIGKSDARRAPRDESSAEPAEAESMEQKAERKRAELARELERKAVAPAKKKRRF